MFASPFSNKPNNASIQDNQFTSGAASQPSFHERVEIEKNRQVVSAYKHSQLGKTVAFRSSQIYSKPRDSRNTGNQANASDSNLAVPSRTRIRQESSTQSHIPPRIVFREPTPRSYNPYA